MCIYPSRGLTRKIRLCSSDSRTTSHTAAAVRGVAIPRAMSIQSLLGRRRSHVMYLTAMTANMTVAPTMNGMQNSA